MGEGVETARAVRADDRTSKASRKGTVEPPMVGPRYIWKRFGWVLTWCQETDNSVLTRGEIAHDVLPAKSVSANLQLCEQG